MPYRAQPRQFKKFSGNFIWNEAKIISQFVQSIDHFVHPST